MSGQVPGHEQKNPAGNEREARTQKTPNTERRSISELLDSRYGAMERQELQRRRAQELVKSVRRFLSGSPELSSLLYHGTIDR